MNLLLKVFAEIVFFRRGPEDLPASSFLLVSSMLAFAVGSVLTSTVHTDGATLIFLEVGADISLMLIWYGSLLIIYDRRARLQQTLTALFGTGALLYLVAFPVLSWLQHAVDEQTSMQLPIWLTMAVVRWSIAVAGRIVHLALDIRFSLGILICFCYFFSSMAVFRFLFGAGA